MHTHFISWSSTLGSKPVFIQDAGPISPRLACFLRPPRPSLHPRDAIHINERPPPPHSDSPPSKAAFQLSYSSPGPLRMRPADTPVIRCLEEIASPCTALWLPARANNTAPPSLLPGRTSHGWKREKLRTRRVRNARRMTRVNAAPGTERLLTP